jgi:glucan phosphoethanolaminetransferase (alkaline phosphatase superfamily)
MFLILLTPAIIFTFKNLTAATVLYHLVFKMSLMSAVLCAGLLFFRPWFVFGVLSLVFLVEVPFESVHLIILERYFSFDAMVATLNTNPVEMRQFSSVLLPYYGVMVFLVVLYVVLFLMSRSVTIPRAGKKRIAWLGVASVALFVLIFVNYARYDPFVARRGGSQSTVVFYWYVLGEYPLNFYDKLRQYYDVKRHRAEIQEGRNAFAFTCSRPDTPDQPEAYVLVIGEGIRYANWHLNGYARETSPVLDTVQHLLSFKHMYSTGTYTASGVPLLLSRGTPFDFDRAYREKTIVTLFKQAGFTTYWVSNQNIFGYIVDPAEVDHLYELGSEAKSDLVVLPKLREVLADTSHSKKFIVVNLLGNHTWAGSFPEEFARYKPTLEYDHRRVLSDANKEYFINRYDNVILVQDYVLGNIIRLLEEKAPISTMLFASDHGLSLFDEGGNLFGYSGTKVADTQVHIPMFIWTSDAWRRDFPKKWGLLSHRTDEPCSTTNVFYTVGEMANIEGEYLNPAASLCNEQFRVDSVRAVFFEGKVDIIGKVSSDGSPQGDTGMIHSVP